MSVKSSLLHWGCVTETQYVWSHSWRLQILYVIPGSRVVCHIDTNVRITDFWWKSLFMNCMLWNLSFLDNIYRWRLFRIQNARRILISRFHKKIIILVEISRNIFVSFWKEVDSKCMQNCNFRRHHVFHQTSVLDSCLLLLFFYFFLFILFMSLLYL